MTSEPNILVEGYKVFQSDWSCLGYQYHMGKTHDFEGEIQMEKAGFHFCARALDCIRYYKLDGRYKYAKVRASNQVITVGDKSVTNRLEVISEISYANFLKLCTGVLMTKLSKTTYRDGIKSGEYVEWYHSATDQPQMKTRSQYENNRLHGLTEEWTRKGFKTHYSIYVRGEMILKFACCVDGKINLSYQLPWRQRKFYYYVYNDPPLVTRDDLIALTKRVLQAYSDTS